MEKEIEYILEANALYHVYESKAEDGNVVALRGLHVKVKPGEAVAVVGPSGSGKSTLLKSLGGLMKPSAGNVSLYGQNMTRLTGPELVELRQKTVSFIFQEGNLLPHLSAVDNVAQPLRHQKVPAREAKRRALELLKDLGMEHRAKGLPATLSGGEQQRVAIARALITKPKLILADEPTGALDPITSREVIAIFDKLHREDNVAFLIVTHNKEVAEFADRALELRDGRFIAEHGSDMEITDLTTGRELIIDDLGTISLPPDALVKLGGAGKFLIEEIEQGRLVLTGEKEEIDSFSKKSELADSCVACGHNYGDSNEELCPKCGAVRIKV